MINDITLQGFSCRHFTSIKSDGRDALILLPGNLMEIETMELFNVALARDYDYAIVELPGYGAAQPLDPKFGMDFLSECLETYKKSIFGHRKTHIIGVSYSSAVAVEYAKTHSDQINSMCLVGAMPMIPVSNRTTFIELMYFSLNDKRVFAEKFIDLLTNPGVGLTDRKHRAIVRAAKMKALRNSDADAWRFINNTTRILSYHPGDTSTIDVPTLCMTGEHDTYVTPENCKALTKMIKGAEFTVIPDCDHLFHLEHPELCLELVTQFIANQQKLFVA